MVFALKNRWTFFEPVVSETLVPIFGFVTKDLHYRLENCVWFWDQEF